MSEIADSEPRNGQDRVERPRTVLVTGAGGHMAGMIVPRLAEHFRLRLLDVKELESDPDHETWVADLTDPDRTRYQDAFSDVDVVVHLGYVRSSPDGVYDLTVPHLERFDAELANIRMAYNVYRCALEAGAKRVVAASSNHAADWYEHTLIHAGAKSGVSPEELPLSDNLYGWAKSSYELLAFPFACGTFGRPLEMVMVRIGAPREVDPDAHIGREQSDQPSLPSGTAGLKRDLGAYLSPDDAGAIFRAAIDAEDIRDANGVPWQVVYGISGNTRAFWSLESARKVLGYEPVDDSEVRFAHHVDRWLTGPDSQARPGRLG